MGKVKKIVDGVVVEVDDNTMVKVIENGVVVERPMSEVNLQKQSEQPSPEKKNPSGTPSQGGLQGFQGTPPSPSTATPLPDQPLAGLGGVEVPKKGQEWKPTSLNPDEEAKFKDFMTNDPNVVAWAEEFKQNYGDYPEIDEEGYDYRGAWKSGQTPTPVETENGTEYHWGSIGEMGKELKSPDHPTRWKSDYMQLFGKNPDEGGVSEPVGRSMVAAKNVIGKSLREAQPDPGTYVIDGRKVSRDEMKRMNQDRSFSQAVLEGQHKIEIYDDPAMEEYVRRQVESRQTNDVYDSLISGLNRAAGWGAGSYLFVNDLLSDITGIPNTIGVVSAAVGPQQGVKKGEAIAGAISGKRREEVVEVLADFNRRAEEAAEKRFQMEGEFIDMVNPRSPNFSVSNAVNTALNNTAESAASSLVIGLGTAATGGLVTGGLLVSPLFIGGEYGEQELSDDAAIKNLSKVNRYLRPALRGGAEVAGEVVSAKIWAGTAKLLTASMKSLVKKTAAEIGTEAAEEVAKESSKRIWEQIGISVGIDPLMEGFSELATYSMQELTDVLMGVSNKTPEQILKEALNSFALGWASGQVMTSPRTAIGGISLGAEGVKASKRFFDETVAFDPQGLEELNEAVRTMRERGQERQADIVADNLAKREKAVNAVPKDKVADTETVDTVEEIQALEESKKGLHPVYQEPIQEQINARTEKLKEGVKKDDSKEKNRKEKIRKEAKEEIAKILDDDSLTEQQKEEIVNLIVSAAKVQISIKDSDLTLPSASFQMPSIQIELRDPFKKRLIELGYSDADISKMTIEQQQDIIESKREAPEVVSSAKVDSVKESERQSRIAEMQRSLDEPEASTSGTSTEMERRGTPVEITAEAPVDEQTPSMPDQIPMTKLTKEGEYDMEDPFTYQQLKGEKLIQKSETENGVAKWDENSLLVRERIENAGDILRELSLRGPSADRNYLYEKINNLKGYFDKLKGRDLLADERPFGAMNRNEDLFRALRRAWYNQPTSGDAQAAVRRLVLELADGNSDGKSLNRALDNVVAEIEKTIPAEGTQSNKQSQAEPAKQPETEVVSESELNKKPTAEQDGKDRIDRLSPREEQGRSRSGRANEEATKVIGGVQGTGDTVGDTEGTQEAAVAPKQDAVGEKSVSKFVELEQKLGRTPTESEVFQVGMGTPVDEVVEQSKSKKTLTAKEAGVGDILPDFKAVPTESVTTDEARFQGRESLDESRVQQIVDEFDERKLDPIVAWKDPETGSMTVLSGHHRFEAVKRMGMENVPVREFVGTEQEAIDFARDSNVLGKQESPVERAARYRQLREEGVSEAELQRRARSAHGKDATFMLNLSRLDPKGKAMDAIRQFDESTDKSTRSRIEAVADWMGALKKVHPDVSKAQEAEMFDYLMETYSPKSGKGKISTRNQFVDVASAVIDRMKNNGTFNDGAVLNLGNIAGKGTLEMEYDAKLEEAKQNELDARKNLDEKRKELLVRNASQSQMDKVLLPYEDALRNAIKTVADIRGMKEQAIAGDRAQISLFDEIAEPTTPTDENTERRIERVLEEGRGPQGRTETGTGRGQTKPKKSEGKKSRDAKRDKLKQDIKSLKDDLWNDLNSLGFAATPDKLGKDAQEFTDRLIKLAKLSIQDAGMSLEDFIKEVLSKYTGKRTDVAELSEIAYNAAKDAYIRETAKEMTSTEGRKETDDKFNEAHNEAFEFAEKELSGIMNALVPEEKKGVYQKEKRNRKETLERGKAMIQSGAINPSAFISAILKSPRPLSSDEIAAMVYYKTMLDNRVRSLSEQSSKARENGDAEGVSVTELALDEVDAQIDEYYQFQEATGYEQGHSLGMRQLLLGSEYEIANQVRKYKKATGKSFVPPDVMAKFKLYDEAIRELSKRIDEFEKRSEEASESLEILSEPDSGETKTKSDAAKLFAKKIRQKKFVKSAKQLATLQSDPTGLFKFAWDSALEFIATTVEQSGSIADAVDGAIKIMTESDWYRKLSDKGKRDFEKIAKPSLSQEAMEYLGITTPTLTDGFLHIPDSFVKDLIRNGFDTIETATTEAKRFMLENLGIDATERQVRDAISDYGKRSKLNKDEVSQKMREMKRVGKLLSALEDVQRKKKPLRSGRERDAMTQKEREIKREINALLKDIPQTSEETDAAWKSALDATKTRLRNRIEDVQKQIAEGKKTPKKKSIELDAEAKYLKEEVDRLNEILRSIEGKPEMTFEQRVKITEQAIERSIQEYERRIREKDFEPMSKEPVSTPEIEALRTKREQLRKQYSEEYSKSPAKDTARDSSAMKRLQKQIDELTEKIHGRISIESKKEAAKEYGAHVKAMQERVKSLREALRDTEQGKELAERRALENMKKATTRSIQEYERRIREKDFAVKKSREVALDAEAKSLKAEQQKWKNRFDTEREKYRIDERTKTEKLREGLVDVIGVFKSLVASLDFGSVLRQGGLLSARHPKMAVSAAKEMIKQTFSEAAYERWMDEVIVSDIYNDAKKAGLYIATPNAKLLAKEESFVSNIAEMIPIYGRLVRASNRAYSSYLNVMRIAVFTDFQNQIDKSGLSEKSADMAKKDMAAFINNATGRGSLLGYEPNSPELNILFFSPRFVLSRANIVMNTATGYANYHPKVRKEALLTVAAYVSAVTTLILLSTMAGADAEDDPRSSDFGKIRIGKLRLDPLAGLSQMVVFFSRMITGQTKSISTGEVRNLGEGRFGRNRLGVIGSFIRSKMAPIPSAFIDMADSPDGKVKTWGVPGVMEFENKVYFKNIVGEEQTIPERAMSLVTPMYTQGAIEIYQEEGFLMTAAATGSDIIGIGSQYHSTANAGSAETNLSKSQKELEEEMTAYKESLLEKLRESKAAKGKYVSQDVTELIIPSVETDKYELEFGKRYKDAFGQEKDVPKLSVTSMRKAHNLNTLREKMGEKTASIFIKKDGEGKSLHSPIDAAARFDSTKESALSDEQRKQLEEYLYIEDNMEYLENFNRELKRIQSQNTEK